MKYQVKIKKLFILFFIIFTNLNVIFAQEEQSTQTLTEESPNKIDTICFKYYFFPKDTLIYKVNSIDSLTHNLDAPVFKVREDKYQVVCDSVDFSNNFYLTLTALTTNIKEWSQKSDTVTHTSSPWLGKRVRLVIDTLGNRKKVYMIDSNFAITSMGGAFQPYLFFPIVETCKILGRSWLVKTSDTLYENAFPPAILNQTSLFRMKDTLLLDSEKIALVTFVKTGRGIYNLNNAEIDMHVDNVINMYGELMISLENNIPVQYIATQEQKLSLTINDGAVVPSWQHSTIRYQLESFKRDYSQVKKEIEKLRNELKKKKK
ncbi:MAG: hypothetical protein ACPL1A_02255 [Candidatus Kapaibacteriota bacterium]